jgi:membrane protein DedA with SNARE-associated domain
MQASRRTLTWLVTPIVILITAGTIANAFLPTLVREHPLWLVALEPRNRNLLLVANKVDAVPFVLIGTFRRLLSDPLFYLLGYLYGARALRWVERRLGGGEEIGEFIERWFRKASYVMVFLFPGALVCVLAGVTRMKPKVFAALNVIGTVSAVLVIRAFAKALEGPITSFTDWTDRNYRVLTVVSIALTAVYLVTQWGQGKLKTVSGIEREIEEGDPEVDA